MTPPPDLITLGSYLDLDATQPALSVEEVLKAEQEFFDARTQTPHANEDRIGLALSGGGIRSATFNLGILTALAEKGALTKLDYLSAVSGGGYIGAWLISWIHRLGIHQVQASLATAQQPGRVPEPIKFLRQYSNYLTPRIGGFSPDTWAMIAIYIRNLSLTLSVIIPSLACVLLLPRLAITVLRSDTVIPYNSDDVITLEISWILLPAISLLIWVAGRRYKRGEVWAGPIVWVVFLMSNLLAHLIYIGFFSEVFHQLHRFTHWVNVFVDGPRAYSLFTGFCLVVLLGCVYLVIQQNLMKIVTSLSADWRRPLKVVVIAVALVIFLFLCARSLPFIEKQMDEIRQLHAAPRALFIFTAGVLALTLVLVTFGNFVIGILGSLSEHKREAIGRFSGEVLLLNLRWAVLCGFALFAPYFLYSATSATKGATFLLLWLLPTLLSVALVFEQSPLRRMFPHEIREVILNFSPYVFLAGLLTVLAHGLLVATTVWGVQKDREFAMPPYDFPHYLESLYNTCNLEVIWSAALFATTALFFSARFGINQYSLHNFYRNRLIRAYLGASNCSRKEKTYAGFDDDDDLQLSEFADPTKYSGPYPIFNASLNLVRGDELAWQERKAANFIFSPLFSGYDTTQFPPVAQRDLLNVAYRPTKFYAYEKGVSLGTAVALSGAAVSTNMGRHTSPRTGFLMSVFNVRLGWWLSNPRHISSWNKRGPRSRIDMLWQEFTSGTSDRRPYVYVSDGGHFENLGLYELVRRRIGVIICSDASHDPEKSCDDLGRAIEKCRADFGYEIEIDLRVIRNKLRRYEIGRINYGAGQPPGVLVYVKPAVEERDPADLQCYMVTHPSFPHDSTANQWFLESQFEAYRVLGEVTGREMLSALDNGNGFKSLAESEFQRAKLIWARKTQKCGDAGSTQGGPELRCPTYAYGMQPSSPVKTLLAEVPQPAKD